MKSKVKPELRKLFSLGSIFLLLASTLSTFISISQADTQFVWIDVSRKLSKTMVIPGEVLNITLICDIPSKYRDDILEITLVEELPIGSKLVSSVPKPYFYDKTKGIIKWKLDALNTFFFSMSWVFYDVLLPEDVKFGTYEIKGYWVVETMKGEIFSGGSGTTSLTVGPIRLVEIQSTITESEFQGESLYLHILLRNDGAKSATIDIKVETNALGWDVEPEKVVTTINPKEFSRVTFLLKFDDDAKDGEIKVSVYEQGNEIASKIVRLRIEDKEEKWIIKTLGNALDHLFLYDLWLLMRAKGHPFHTEVVEYVKSVLVWYGLTLESPDMDKARAMLDFVLDHMVYERIILVPPIEMMIKKLKNGETVKGDCKVYSILYGGLMSASGVDVRLVSGMMENSRYPLGLFGHVWVESYISGKWMFGDPTSRIFNDTEILSAGETLRWTTEKSANVKFTDPKKYYDSNIVGWGGPLYTLAYDGDRYYDLSQEYKYETIMPIPSEETVVFVHSPVNLTVIDEAGNLVDTGKTFIYMHGEEAFLEGQFVILPEKLDKFKVKISAISSGEFNLGIFKKGNIKMIKTSVEKGQTLYYGVDTSLAEIAITQVEAKPVFDFLYLSIIVGVVAIFTALLILRHKGKARKHQVS